MSEDTMAGPALVLLMLSALSGAVMGALITAACLLL